MESDHCVRRDCGHIIEVVRLLAKGLLFAWLIVALAYLPAARAETPVPDTEQSARLTDYLHAHRLPLVGAQVLSSGTGRSVLLYGYTATDFGKGDAEVKARQFLKDSDFVISNHIRVRPELSSMRSPSRSASSSSAFPPGADTGVQAPSPEAAPPDVEAYKNRQQDTQQQYINQQTQQYMNQGNSASSLTSALIPLLGMGLAIGLGGGSSGFGMGVSPGFGSFGGSPFGGSQYGSPYGGGPYGYPSGPSPYGGPSNPYP